MAAQPTTAISPVGVNKSRALEVEPELTCLVTLELRLRDSDVPQCRPSVGDRDTGLEPLSEKAVTTTDIEDIAAMFGGDGEEPRVLGMP